MWHRRPGLLLVMLAALVTLGAGCGTPSPKVQELTVVARDFRFLPSDLQVKKGQPVRVTFRNEDLVIHDWVVLKIPATDKQTQYDSGHGEGTHPEHSVYTIADVGRVGTVAFTPEQAGKYEIICSITGHQTMGMRGSLTVR